MDLISPSVDSQNKVINWIMEIARQHSPASNVQIENLRDRISVIAPGKKFETNFFSLSVIVIEHLFNTNMHAFINKKTSGIAIKHLGSLSIPAQMLDIIEVDAYFDILNISRWSLELLNCLQLLNLFRRNLDRHLIPLISENPTIVAMFPILSRNSTKSLKTSKSPTPTRTPPSMPKPITEKVFQFLHLPTLKKQIICHMYVPLLLIH
jgi:hypothetical protein